MNGGAARVPTTFAFAADIIFNNTDELGDGDVHHRGLQ